MYIPNKSLSGVLLFVFLDVASKKIVLNPFLKS